MTASTTLRHLTREARQQQRMKARLAAWWHVERCPPRAMHLVGFPLTAGLRGALDACRPQPPCDDTPDPDGTKAH
jgi:hypothetical protein